MTKNYDSSQSLENSGRAKKDGPREYIFSKVFRVQKSNGGERVYTIKKKLYPKMPNTHASSESSLLTEKDDFKVNASDSIETLSQDPKTEEYNEITPSNSRSDNRVTSQCFG